MGQRQMLHQAQGRRGLGGVLAHELEPGRGVVKEVTDQDGGALRGTHGADLLRHAALQVQRGAGVCPGGAGEDVQPGHGGDGRQSLAPEAQGADAPQVLTLAELGGGVAQKGGGQLLGGDAAAVVGDPDEAHAAPLELHHHGGAVGVNGVFHQLLDHAGRPLHHLSGGDQVGHVGIQLLNMGHMLLLSWSGRPAAGAASKHGAPGRHLASGRIHFGRLKSNVRGPRQSAL